jgi:hypothetical protein
MDIFIDGTRRSIVPPLPLTWKSLIDLLLEKEITPSHGIVRVVVDGREDNSVMVARKPQPIAADTRVIEFYTKDIHAISRDGIIKGYQLIEFVRQEALKSADLYRRGQIEEASSRLVQVMEALMPLINFIKSVGGNYNIRFNEILLEGGQSAQHKIDAISVSLQGLVAAQEKKDFVEVADFLEYQLTDDLSGWGLILDKLALEIELAAQKPV